MNIISLHPGNMLWDGWLVIPIIMCFVLILFFFLTERLILGHGIVLTINILKEEPQKVQSKYSKIDMPEAKSTKKSLMKNKKDY